MSTRGKPFVMGESLIWPELLNMLPTTMRELHEWYMRVTADADVMFAARLNIVIYIRG
jgi:hypothetical protein